MDVDALRVQDYMTTDMTTVTPDTEIMRAIAIMTENDISGLLVVTEEGRLLGILTERDIIRAALNAGYHDESAGLVGDVMSAPVETMSPEDNLLDVGEFFAESPMRRCPVVIDGVLVGLICRRDVLKALADSSWFPAPP